MKFSMLYKGGFSRALDLPMVHASSGFFSWPGFLAEAERAQMPERHKRTPATVAEADQRARETADAWSRASGDVKRREVWALLALVERWAVRAETAPETDAAVLVWDRVYIAHCAYRALVSACHSDTAGEFTINQKSAILKRARESVLRSAVLALSRPDSHNVVNALTEDDFLSRVSA